MRVQNRYIITNVYLVERNALAAAYLREILDSDPSIRILPEWDVQGGVPSAGVPTPVFIVDVDTLTHPAATCLTVVRSHFPDAKILFLGRGLSSDELRRLSFLAVQGFVRYNDVKDQLRPAIRAISNGQIWFPPEVAEEMLTCHPALRSHEESLKKGGRDIFTSREKMVIGLVQRRLCNKEISLALRISESTVKFHLSNIFRKLGVNDRASAAEAAGSQMGQAAFSQPCSEPRPRGSP